MNEITKIRPSSYIPAVPKEGARWAPRSSYQLGRKSDYLFDLRSMKRTSPSKSRFSFIEGLKNFIFPEEEFILPTLEEYLTVFPTPSKPDYAFAPTYPFPDASISPSENLVYTGLPEEVTKVPLGKFAFFLPKGLKATLHKDKDGSYYLKLPDTLVHNLQAFVKDEGGILPTHFQLLDGVLPKGAHIPTILRGESPETLKETGEEFYFFLLGVYQHKVRAYPGLDTVWYLSFESPDLESLRQKYGLQRKIKGFDFTCLIATKAAASPTSPPVFAINPANFAA